MSRESRARRGFASDNNAGVCPPALAAMAAANEGHTPAYGTDGYTDEACAHFRELFETDCDVYFTFNGTAANSLALASLCHSYHSVICHRLAHVETDECGAPEFFSGGAKMLLADGEDGKCEPGEIAHLVTRRQDIHYPKPKAVSLTQATEVGTVYTPAELEAIGALARELGLRVHMDGARFANAVASLGCSPAALTWRAGVDVLCFGGTKNGLAVGEAVVFFDRALGEEFDYRCKQAGQLCSKMRYLAAPWTGLLAGDTWLANACNANERARSLARGLADMSGVAVLFPVEANSVFIRLDPARAARLRERGWTFYDFIGAGGIRLMCSWDTSEADVAAFLADLAEC